MNFIEITNCTERHRTLEKGRITVNESQSWLRS